jgi:hypothetical protein
MTHPTYEELVALLKETRNGSVERIEEVIDRAMPHVIDLSARAIFDKLGKKTPGRVPNWDIQPEHLKDVFRRKVVQGQTWYHYGADLAFFIENDFRVTVSRPDTPSDRTSYARGVHRRKITREAEELRPQVSDALEATRAAQAKLDSLKGISDSLVEKLAHIDHVIARYEELDI